MMTSGAEEGTWSAAKVADTEDYKKRWLIDLDEVSKIRGKNKLSRNTLTEKEIDRQYAAIDMPLQKAVALYGIVLLEQRQDSVLAAGIRRYITRCTVNHFTSYQRVPELESQDP